MVAWETEKAKLEQGKSTSLLVAQAQQNLLTAQINEVQAITGYLNKIGIKTEPSALDPQFHTLNPNIQVGASAAMVLGLQRKANTPNDHQTLSYSEFPEIRMDAEKLVNTGKSIIMATPPGA